MKKVIVLSLGGSQIIPDDIDVEYLKKFKKVISKNVNKYKFVIVCGGGSVARKYMNALDDVGINEKLQCFAGISTTRMNARFMSYFFGVNQKQGIPHELKSVEKLVKKKDIIFCGALEYKPDQTSDSTAAGIAKHFKSDFINLTNIKGLYSANPKTNKNAKFIPEISWKDFFIMANKMKYKPGQHFVLDQKASKIIMKNKINTYILSTDLKQLNNLLNEKKFVGTTIKN